MKTTLTVLAIPVLFTLSCASESPPPEVPAGCNPVTGDDCMGPFPSSFYETADSTSATGVRVAVSNQALPVSMEGIQVTGDRMNGLDGFSPSTRFIVYVKQLVDAARLPKSAELSTSVTALSTVQILEFESGERVPLFAELDANAHPEEGDRQAILVQPMARLKPGKRYVIVMTGLKDTAGHALSVRPFRALRDRTALSKSLTPLKSRYEEIFSMLERNGLQRSTIDLAWDVIIGSDANTTGHLLSMRNEAIAMANAGQLSYSITSTTTPTDDNLLREVLGTVTVPNYLSDDRMSLNVDGAGKPTMRGTVSVPFVAHIPKCAATATAPLPVMFYGHGLFFSAAGELNTGYLKQLGQRLCMVQIGTDWTGLTIDDIADIVNKVVGDWNNFHMITDRLQQGHTNAQVLTRLFARVIKDDDAFKLTVGGKSITDAKEIYYYGISLGGTSGGVFLPLSSDVSRGVVNSRPSGITRLRASWNKRRALS